MLGTAREGWHIGIHATVPAWRAGWAGYAEMAALAWIRIKDLTRPIDAGTWRMLEQTPEAEHPGPRRPHPALVATSALVRKMLVQTGRAHFAKARTNARSARSRSHKRSGARCARRPCPEPFDPPDLTEQWWLVEIERPGNDERNAVALWNAAEGAEVTLAAFLDVDERSCHTPSRASRCQGCAARSA